MRHAIVNKQGIVVNVCEWKGDEWLPPKDHYVVRHDKCDIGDTYNFETHEFIKPPYVEQPVEEQQVQPSLHDMMSIIKDLQKEVAQLKGENS